MAFKFENISGRFHFSLAPAALIRAYLQDDGRIAIEAVTPASSMLTIDLIQAKALLASLTLAVKEAERQT